MKLKHVRQAANCAAPHKVPVGIVDRFEVIQVEQQNGKWPARAA
jgi:hypothetical protein